MKIVEEMSEMRRLKYQKCCGKVRGNRFCQDNKEDEKDIDVRCENIVFLRSILKRKIQIKENNTYKEE